MDVTSSSELYGKVVVVTKIKNVPQSCNRCPYYRTGPYMKHLIGFNCGACWINGWPEYIKYTKVSKERLPDCPLRLVGR